MPEVAAEAARIPVKAGDEEESVPAAVVSDLGPTEDSAPVGPSADEEAAFLSAERESGVTIAAMPAATTDEDEKSELPPMEDLVKRIPAPARELIEDLFRARFVTVKRLPKASLKN